MSTPYTREEIDLMSTELLIELYNKKSSLLHPYSLIGTDILDARKQMTYWSKSKVEILISGKNGCSMDFYTSYWWCNIDENNIITKIWKAFENAD